MKALKLTACILSAVFLLGGAAGASASGSGELSPGQELIVPLPLTEMSPQSEVINAGTLPAEEKQIALTFDLGCHRPVPTG